MNHRSFATLPDFTASTHLFQTNWHEGASSTANVMFFCQAPKEFRIKEIRAFSEHLHAKPCISSSEPARRIIVLFSRIEATRSSQKLVVPLSIYRLRKSAHSSNERFQLSDFVVPGHSALRLR